MAAGVTGPAKRRDQKAAFDAMVGSYDSGMAKLAKRTRRLVLEVMPGAIEIVWPKQGIASYGTGPKKMSQHFCYLKPAKAHLGLGFYYGAELDDPDGLLEGTGKLMRHVKITDAGQLASPALRALVAQASTHRVPPLP